MLKRLYDDEESKDVTFQLDSGRTFSAHRCILRISSVDWFNTLFKSDFREAQQTVIGIRDCRDDVFEIILRWAYELPSPYASVAHHFEAADRFLAPSLIQHYAETELGISIYNYVEFLAQMMKYPLAFRHIMADVNVRHFSDIKDALSKPEYKDRAEEIILFMLTKCHSHTDYLQYFLGEWLALDDNKFGKSPLDMREITALLLNKAQFMQPKYFKHDSFKETCKRLIVKGYYTQAEITKLSVDNGPLLLFQSYPLKIAKIVPIGSVIDVQNKILGVYNRATNKAVHDYDLSMGTDGYYHIIEF